MPEVRLDVSDAAELSEMVPSSPAGSTKTPPGVIGVFGPPLQWPTWMMGISPFSQIPKLPGGTVSADRCSGSAASRWR